MDIPRHVTVELSTEPYRIVEFHGAPDPQFVEEVEKECAGLVPDGITVFTTFSNNASREEFSRAPALEGTKTYAMLWKESIEPVFPDEFMINKLQGRQEWSIALVSIPEYLSLKSILWLESATGIPVVPPKPAINVVWPFFAKQNNEGVVECCTTNTVILSTTKILPISKRDHGPTLLIQSATTKQSTVGVEQSPAFFALKPEDVANVRVADANNSNINTIISFSLHASCPPVSPTVELAFKTPDGSSCVVPLHLRRCADVVTTAREQGWMFAYLSMPSGASGTLRVSSGTERCVTKITCGDDLVPHSGNKHLPSPEVLTRLSAVLTDPRYDVEIDFRGFGRLRLARFDVHDKRVELDPALRQRLLSFILQLQPSFPREEYMKDAALIDTFVAIRPKPLLIPHHRSLLDEISVCKLKL
jgi:hypothetical protein